jgi:hypothetical protein
MNAAVVHKLGDPPRCDEFPEPVAGDDKVVVHVLAASLKPVDKQMAGGSHYASPRKVPFICGTDGVGRLGNRQRVFFGGCQPPYGAMAQRTLVPKTFIFPVPTGMNDSFLRKSRLLVKPILRDPESLIQVPETRSAFHPRAQRNAFRRRDAHRQRRLFARKNPKLRRSPTSIRLC